MPLSCYYYLIICYFRAQTCSSLCHLCLRGTGNQNGLEGIFSEGVWTWGFSYLLNTSIRLHTFLLTKTNKCFHYLLWKPAPRSSFLCLFFFLGVVLLRDFWNCSWFPDYATALSVLWTCGDVLQFTNWTCCSFENMWSYSWQQIKVNSVWQESQFSFTGSGTHDTRRVRKSFWRLQLPITKHLWDIMFLYLFKFQTLLGHVRLPARLRKFFPQFITQS